MICKLFISNSSILSRKGFILTMWYVNTNVTEVADMVAKRFILTMWYVNLALSMSLTASTSRFILTMWYVNSNKVVLNNALLFVLY